VVFDSDNGPLLTLPGKQENDEERLLQIGYWAEIVAVTATVILQCSNASDLESPFIGFMGFRLTDRK
jgi:hypothetical protein